MCAARIERGQSEERRVDRGVAFVDDVILVTGSRLTAVVVSGNGLGEIAVTGRACVERSEAGGTVVRLYKGGSLIMERSGIRQKALTIKHGRRG